MTLKLSALMAPFGTDGSVGFGFGDDSGFGIGVVTPNPVEGCEFAEVFVAITIFCGETGDLLEDFGFGPFEGENGSATLIAANGEICEGPIEGMAGVQGDCETQQPGTG